MTAVTAQNPLQVIISRVNAAGQLFGPPAPILRPDASGPLGDLVVVVADSAGRVTVVWEEPRGVQTQLFALSVAPDGNIGTPFALSGGAGEDQPHAAVAPDGTVTVVWEGAGEKTIETRRIGPSGTAIGAGPTIVKPDTGGDVALVPRVAVAPDGAATVVWTSRLDGVVASDIAARRIGPAGTPAGTEIPVATDRDNDKPDVAGAPDGTATVVWERELGDKSAYTPAIRRIGPAGSFASGIVELSGVRGNAPRVTALLDGTAAVAWEHHPVPDEPVTRVRTIAPGAPSVSPMICRPRRRRACGSPRRPTGASLSPGGGSRPSPTDRGRSSRPPHPRRGSPRPARPRASP